MRPSRSAGARARAHVHASVLAAAALLLVLFAPRTARADDDPSAIFAQATRALSEGRPVEAVAAFESLADRGVVDPVASYDRGLAYAARVRVGAETPGDLGRAIQGFEEARELTRDPRLAEDATRALTVVRSEVARRRVRAGEPVEVDPGRSLSRTVARLLGEDTWAIVAAAASALLALGLFVRWIARAARLRIASGVAAGIAAPALLLSALMTLASRHDRHTLREAVVVAASARPTDDRGIALAGATALPEGARVEVLDDRGGSRRIRFGTVEAWLPAESLRELARPDEATFGSLCRGISITRPRATFGSLGRLAVFRGMLVPRWAARGSGAPSWPARASRRSRPSRAQGSSASRIARSTPWPRAATRAPCRSA
jgi:hypothetical protein